MRVPPGGVVRPRVGDRVSVLTGQWKGWQGVVDDLLDDAVTVRFGSGFKRTFLPEDLKLTPQSSPKTSR